MNHSHAIRNRLRRIEGQVRGLQRLADKDAPCIDIITQVAAAQTALEQVSLQVLEAHIRERVAQAATGGEGKPAEETINDVLVAVRRFSERQAAVDARAAPATDAGSPTRR